MNAAIITVAGISSRFNAGVDDNKKCLKAIYSDGASEDTLLARLVQKCNYYDRIIVVGGYKYNDLEQYIKTAFSYDVRRKIGLVRNKHYCDLASGFSLLLGLEQVFTLRNLEEILFVEGDLAIDNFSFQKVVTAKTSVATYNYEPIHADKAVVLYRNGKGQYKYAFNRERGLLQIEEPFSAIWNSGQLWKFRNIPAIAQAAHSFSEGNKDETNLKIIQDYMSSLSDNEIEIIGLQHWVNCNTREDFKKIREV